MASDAILYPCVVLHTQVTSPGVWVKHVPVGAEHQLVKAWYHKCELTKHKNVVRLPGFFRKHSSPPIQPMLVVPAPTGEYGRGSPVLTLP